MPTATPTPTVTPTPAPLTAAQIFAAVSPSLAFVQTGGAGGSGLLIEGGYVVTNAHVVWPFEEARVVFPDGTEHLGVPVLNSDLMGDLAVLGPIDTSVSPLALVDGEGLAIGSTVYLIGYPGEAGGFPQPSITSGILSRLRQWEAIGMTYLQTDAAVAGGQSGGVLVSEDGDLIGISGFSFTEAGFGVVASGADVMIRINGLIAGEDVAGLGDRRLPLEGGKLEFDFVLNSLLAQAVYVLNEPAGTLVDIQVESESDVFLSVIDLGGFDLIFADDTVTGVESGSATTALSAPYFFVVLNRSDDPTEFRVRSNVELALYEDPDDGKAISVGQTAFGALDFPTDIDVFFIELEAGETVEITLYSASIDPFLAIRTRPETHEPVVDDDSGGGLFGLNAKLTYRAPHTGSYAITISDAFSTGVGGYIFSVAEAPPGAAAVLPVAIPVPTTIDSPFGQMALYESAQYPFSIQYPAEWPEQPVAPEELTAAFFGEEGGQFFIAEEAVAVLGLGEVTLSAYTDVILSTLSAQVPGFELLSRDQQVTTQGLPAEVLEIGALGGFVRATRLIVMHEGIAFNATYFAPKERHADLADMIAYSLGTFRVEGLGAAADARAAEPALVAGQRPLAQEQTLYVLRYGCCNLLPHREGGWGRQFMTWTSMMSLKFNKNNEFEPHLALSYDVSNGTKSYTIHLDPDAIFHDGTPVTAASVKKAWEFGVMPAQQVAWGALSNNLKDVIGIDPVKVGDATEAVGLVVLDDHTLQINLSTADVVYPKKMAQWLMGVWKAEQAESDPDWLTHPIGVGPYAVTANLYNRYIHLDAVRNWWKEPVIIQKAEIPYVPDQQTQMVMYENGKVDLIFAGPGFQAAPHNPDHPFFNDLYRIPYGGIFYYALDHTKPPLDDPKVRAAIAHGYDQNTVVRAVFGHGGIPAHGLVTPESVCSIGPEMNPGYVFDPAKARALLAESTYGGSENIPPMLISFPAGYDANWIRYTEAMQAMLLDNLGLDMRIEIYGRGQSPPDANMSRRSIGITTADPAYPLRLLGHSDSLTNQSRLKFEDPALDQLIDQAAVLALDDPGRCDAWQAAERRFLEGYHLLPTIQVNYPYLVQPWVNNFEMSVNNDFVTLPEMSISERVRFQLPARRRY